MPYEEELNLLVGVHRMDKLTEQEKKIIIKLPSLLGRDIIRKIQIYIQQKRKSCSF